MTRVYAIGDIHGHLDALRRVHRLIEADRRFHGWDDAPVVHLGDLVDRGPDSAGVIGWLMAEAARRRDIVVLQGNHDRMMRLFLQPEPRRDPCLRQGLTWFHPRVGGLSALHSYGVETGDLDEAGAGREGSDLAALHARATEKVPAAHIGWLAGLQNALRLDAVFLVHAGIRPGVPLDRQQEDDMLWIRDAFHTDPRDHGALVVHGHTPVDAVTHYGNRVNLDTGAGYGYPISAVAIEGRNVWQLEAGGRVALPVPDSFRPCMD
ncbi:MAG: serine/threonine protein phosphatase [Rhodobacteraceae bacterium]|nr:serine/threonine protein phosphatase [Paracoccaceae bacterium]